MEKFSFSKIDAFKMCPYKYKLQYINKIRQDITPSIDLLKGRLLHLILERRLSNTFDPEDEDIRDLVRKLANEDGLKLLKAIKKFTLTEFFASLNLENSAVEKWFYLNTSFKPCGYDDAFINGKIDYIEEKEEEVLLIDWKVGRKTAKERAFFKTDDLQLDIYSLWALQKYRNVKHIRAMLYYVESNTFSEKLYTMSDIEKIQESLIYKILAIKESTEFKRNPGPLCDYCSYFMDYCNVEEL